MTLQPLYDFLNATQSTDEFANEGKSTGADIYVFVHQHKDNQELIHFAALDRKQKKKGRKLVRFSFMSPGWKEIPVK